MGKYMVSPMGVRTRAKTLALKSPPIDYSSYIQLRSRSLQKIQNPNPRKNTNRVNFLDGSKSQRKYRSSRLKVSNSVVDSSEKPTSGESLNLEPDNKESRRKSLSPSHSVTDSTVKPFVGEEDLECDNRGSASKSPSSRPGVADSIVEPSFVEGNLELDNIERTTRESTPCSSFIREHVIPETPCSRRRQTFSTETIRVTQEINPTAEEIEEFFAVEEKQQQSLFAEKYNFDVVNDVPLPGRYEWVRVQN